MSIHPIQRWEIAAGIGTVAGAVLGGTAVIALSCTGIGLVITLPILAIIAASATLGSGALGGLVTGGMCKVVDDRTGKKEGLLLPPNCNITPHTILSSSPPRSTPPGSTPPTPGEALPPPLPRIPKDRQFRVNGQVFRLPKRGAWSGKGKEIGRGAFGIVKPAFIDRARLARKVVRSPAAIPAAEYEVEIVKYLKNQGVPHLLEVVYSGHYMKQKRGKEGDAFHAFSTRCDTDLAKELVQHGLQPREKFQVMDQLIEALAAAERAGVAHRDIKPANIFLIRNRDRTLSVKVGDWGLACKLADKPRQELCSGSEKYVPRAYIKRKVPLLETRKLDVFSLAKVFEHILHYPRVQRWPGAPQNAAMIQLIRRMLDPVAATRPSMTEVEAAWAEIKRQILAEHPGEPPAF